jgi:hypothetical protein
MKEIEYAAGRISYATNNSSNTRKHATGLTYVPYDNYNTNLHEGEEVLTKQEAKAYRAGNTGGGGNQYNFYSPRPIDPMEARRQVETVNKQTSLGISIGG